MDGRHFSTNGIPEKAFRIQQKEHPAV